MFESCFAIHWGSTWSQLPHKFLSILFTYFIFFWGEKVRWWYHNITSCPSNRLSMNLCVFETYIFTTPEKPWSIEGSMALPWSRSGCGTLQTSRCLGKNEPCFLFGLWGKSCLQETKDWWHECVWLFWNSKIETIWEFFLKKKLIFELCLTIRDVASFVKSWNYRYAVLHWNCHRIVP